MRTQRLKSTIIALGVCLAFLVLIGLSILPQRCNAALTGLEGHEKYIYPVVRVTVDRGGGSGTIVYSYLEDQNKGASTFTDVDIKAGKSPYYSTYILTNYHVIDAAISITEEWDTDLQKNVSKEKRGIIYVEIFKYRDISTPIGTLKVEADIVLYNKDEDMALLKLRTEESAPCIADLLNKEDIDSVLVMDESIAVGCSLGFPPLPTVGVITRKNFQIQSFPYHMSSSQIIYGNSGGAMFNEAGQLIGIPALVPVLGWSTPITHMGLFIPISRIYDWLEIEHYDFIFDASLTEGESLERRRIEIEDKRQNLK